MCFSILYFELALKPYIKCALDKHTYFVFKTPCVDTPIFHVPIKNKTRRFRNKSLSIDIECTSAKDSESISPHRYQILTMNLSIIDKLKNTRNFIHPEQYKNHL